MQLNRSTSAPSSSASVADVSTAVWRAAAGSSVRVPTVGDRVYYFPQGHFEQCGGGGGGLSEAVLTSLRRSFFHCRVVSVRLLFHPVTDQPFACLHLMPASGGISFNYGGCGGVCSRFGDVFGSSGGGAAFNSGGGYSSSGNVFGSSGGGGGFNSGDVFGSSGGGGGFNSGGGDVDNVEEEEVVSFTKVLTPSDANNGGGFSVPRFCADSIFPRLDFEADPPVQTLVMRDVHGSSYTFRHIYRGTPRRHLLTTGWTKFVNSKMLVAGDSVVFMRKRRTGELYAGVRRALRGGDDDVEGVWKSPSMSVKIEKNKENDWTIKKGVNVESVLDALEKAVRGLVFEVVFYPRPGWSEFIVKAETVEKVIQECWTSGMRVKMPMETEDSTRTSWFQGTVSSATVPLTGPWRGSPWRILEINWDEPETLQHVNRVSPWQVEHVPSYVDIPFPPTKRFKAWEDSGFLPSGGELAFPMTGFSNSPKGPHTTLYSDHTFFPAGMQGARQNQECGTFFSKIQKNDICKMNSENIIGGSLPSDTLSTELNIGSLPSDTSSVDNSNSFNGMGMEGKQDCSSMTKVGRRSFQLFGKIIRMEKPVEDGGGNEECPSARRRQSDLT
ncbi:hypothetical protein LIER_35351 [Lithospermum erythrorhizon]|uniref:Auxin response factor n=1 Tax=Lithospermum erythrorhizon TaxID=34254 RepID=A0AAV3NPD1_LITER